MSRIFSLIGQFFCLLYCFELLYMTVNGWKSSKERVIFPHTLWKPQRQWCTILSTRESNPFVASDSTKWRCASRISASNLSVMRRESRATIQIDTPSVHEIRSWAIQSSSYQVYGYNYDIYADKIISRLLNYRLAEEARPLFWLLRGLNQYFHDF